QSVRERCMSWCQPASSCRFEFRRDAGGKRRSPVRQSHAPFVFCFATWKGGSSGSAEMETAGPSDEPAAQIHLAAPPEVTARHAPNSGGRGRLIRHCPELTSRGSG